MHFDALLLLSFGGPEGHDQVMPFLENVTRGRGIPPERLAAVAEHYHHFGGVSPINGINRALIEQIEGVLADRGRDLPVYFGNRNWEPFVEDTVTAMRDNGVRRAAVFSTSAWGGYSGCAQYQEDIARARSAVPDDGRGPAPELVKLRQYFDHPLFVAMFADAIADAAGTLPAERRAGARLVFTAHSIPLRAANRCGQDLYERQVGYASRLVAAAAGYADFDLVWQSRSGPPQVPWLEPDVGDHLEALVERGVDAVIVCPIGFVADHIEVIWDLDSELAEQADAAGVALARATTPNAQRRFAELVVGLIDELQSEQAPARVVGPQPVPGYGNSLNGNFCTPACVPAPAQAGRPGSGPATR
ncbi:ferrochelatase [Arthrobacter sp. SLBN-53]|uniref:ferrochelatase n=1 Tax=Arthrobacter sp. SLBN-53 TaxID=2768412 RepID=UPI00114D93ED|nr:ferrochelatase [Arthrobacter sp. SLBN-53]TQK31992.1 ferrochelatase [Arthrobacter sp. SLBN-53]